MSALAREKAARHRDPATFAVARRTVAFPHILELLREQYRNEIEYLAEEYRPRIRAGEFSGQDPGRIEGDICVGAEPRYFRLERELATSHPWIRTVGGAMAVIGISPWTLNPKSDVELSTDRIVRLSAGECMAHDILALAVERGWVKPPARGKRQYDEREPYRVAPSGGAREVLS